MRSSPGSPVDVSLRPGGHKDCSDCTSDCDDHDADIHPGVADWVGSGKDGDCNNVETCYDDDDNDGFPPSPGLPLFLGKLGQKEHWILIFDWRERKWEWK